MKIHGHSAGLWLSACLAFTLASCNIGIEISEEMPSEVKRVPVALEARTDDGCKTILDFPSVKWEDSDAIAVFDGVSRNIFTIPAGGNSGTSARFEGEVAEGAKVLYAAYPAAAAETCSDGAITLSVPREQRLSGTAVAASGALASVAVADGGSLIFRNVTSLVKINITSEDICSILVRAPGISGKVQVNADGTIVSKPDPCGEVLLLPAGDCFAPGSYYAALLPGTCAAGEFKVSLVRSDAMSCTRTNRVQTVLKRNGAADAGDPAQGATWERVIFTRDQLFAWNTLRTPLDGTEQVSLGADIDMEMQAWTPRDFAGSFDGCGHRLSGLNVSGNNYVGLFRQLADNAVLKDLVVGSADGTSYDGVSVIRHSKSANNYTWYYAGVVAKTNGASSVTGVVNFATVEVAADAISKTRIGGIVGNWNSSGTLADCVNYGTVRNLSAVTGQASSTDETSNSSIMGGVVGFFDLRNTISDCVNYGSVYSLNPWVSAVGGVVGYDGRGCSVVRCFNAGQVEQKSSSIGVENAVGGVVAYAKGESSAFGIIQDGRNEGSVSAKCDGKLVRVGGVTGYTGYYLLNECSNSGEISFTNASATSGYVAIGGVSGHTYSGTVLTACSNTGTIRSVKPNVNRVGGVAGNINSSSIRECTNSGSVILDNSSVTIDYWQGVGGITGFSEGTGGNREVSGCTNSGSVSVTLNTVGNTNYHRVAVGGIIGMPFTSMTISGNINRGTVSLENKHASAPYAYAGGIMGQDTGADSASALMSNLNYGSVKIIGGREGYSGAGGLFGSIGMAASVPGNCNFGPVQGTVAGAVAGVNALSFNATVCDAVTVNSVKHAAAADKVAWACPQSSGTITLTVVAHSSNETGGLPKPLPAGNKVVAHRGGATESKHPDNSRAGLRYAMLLGCYASECDIYWTKDNKVIVAHATSDDYINGMHPWEHTAEEIISAKRLANYEWIPTLEEYLDIVMESGSRTKLLLDIKMIDTPKVNYDYPTNAALRAIEIIQEKNAQNFVEFICTGYETVMKRVAPSMKAAGLACGWMNGDITAASFKNKGYTDWANLCTRDKMSLGVDGSADKGTGKRTIQEFKDAGLQLSVFHLDRYSGNSSAVYTEANVQLYLDEYDYLKCITTNYPSWLINKTRNL